MKFSDRYEFETYIINEIEKLKKNLKLSDKEFCEIIDVPLNTYKCYKYKQRHISLYFIYKLVNKFDINFIKIFRI